MLYEIIQILNVFFPTEITLKIIYNHNGYQTPSTKAISKLLQNIKGPCKLYIVQIYPTIYYNKYIYKDTWITIRNKNRRRNYISNQDENNKNILIHRNYKDLNFIEKIF